MLTSADVCCSSDGEEGEKAFPRVLVEKLAHLAYAVAHVDAFELETVDEKLLEEIFDELDVFFIGLVGGLEI